MEGKKRQMDHLRERKILRAALGMTRQCWEQGMLSYALLECLRLQESREQATPADNGGDGGENEKLPLQEILELIVYDMVLRQSEDGRLCNVENTPAVTDSAFCIPAVQALGMAAGKEEWTRAAQRNAAYLLHDAQRTQDGVLYHMRGTTQIWADSAAFLPYALVITGYPKEGYLQMTGILDRLYLPQSGMYAHIWEEESRQFVDGNAWAIGEGWILTGLLRTWAALPADMPQEKADLQARFESLLEKFLAWQTPDGGFHDVTDDAATYMETEAAAMAACAVYTGIAEGIVPASYREKADAMAAYVDRMTLPDGRVCGAASSPAFDRPGTSVECQAHALWLHYLRM